MRVVFVHGACVRDGEWWFHPTAEALRSLDVLSSAALLPSCGETAEPTGWDGPGFDEDVAAVRALLTAGDEPTVVVAHSYGGIVTAQAAAGVSSVRHLLLIASYLPEPGESLSSFGGDEPAPFLEIDPERGTFAVRPEMLAATFLQDCSPAIASEARHHLAEQSVSVTQHAVTAAAWQQTPSTYLVCTQDQGTPSHRQREFARRAGEVVELDAGHHPFLSQPTAVAELIARLP